MRIRKNINCLSTDELHDLREAFAGLYLRPASHADSYLTIAGLHGEPVPYYCIHSANGFLSWHRAYLLEMENALRTIRCNVTLPYWNWSSGPTTGIPAACATPTYEDRNGSTVPNPLYSGPKTASLGGGQTSRRGDISTTSFADIATTAQNAMAALNYPDFISLLNSAHGSVHVRVSGDMSSVGSAGFDPIFWLHHANVDRLWAQWQLLRGLSMTAGEAATDLVPFTRPFTNVWHKGVDFDNTADWDYKYQNFCIKWPSIVWPHERFFKVPIEDWLPQSRHIHLVISADQMPFNSAELRVFLNQPEADINTKTVREQGFVGTIGMFGMGQFAAAHNTMGHKKQPFRLALDLTDALKKSIRKNDKEASIHIVPVYAGGHDGHALAHEHFKIELEVE